jgi:hypothetical protein
MNLQLRKTDKLKHCPFCGGTETELCNTHSASYWISCSCGAEMHGRSNNGTKRTDHRLAVVSARDRWNTRSEKLESKEKRRQ